MTERRGGHGSRVGQHAGVWLVVVLFAVAAADAGLRLRRWAWAATDGAHFKGDIASGWRWGDQADRDGLLSFYDDVAADTAAGRGHFNDYTPLRITVMTLWARWTKTAFPGADHWEDDYDFTLPLLRVNAAAEGASAVLAFAVVWVLKRRFWKARSGPPAGALGHDPGPGSMHQTVPPEVPADCGVWAGLSAGLLLWFNPAVVWDGHCWPQWDVWLMPFYLAAVLAACLDAWFVAGVCVVIGAFLKGQMLLAAPVLLLWPLLGGRFGAAFRFVCGVAVAVAALAAPWMRPTPAAWAWVGCVAAALVVLSPAVWVKPLRWRWRIASPLAAMLLAWPWASHVRPGAKFAAIWPLILVAAAGGLPRRLRAHGYALALAVAVLLTMALFAASPTWFTMGFAYGAGKFDRMLTGSGSWNVPALLMWLFDWDRDQYRPVAVPDLATPIALRTLLLTAYGAALVLCGLAAAVQSRRRDPRLLAALTAAWLWAFLLLPQMHGRYSVWAAAASALLAAEGVGPALLGVLVSVIAWLGIVQNQLLFVRNWSPETLALLNKLDPHLGWALLTAAAVMLGLALTPRPRPPGR